MAFCTKCGKSNSDNARFCTSCGSTLTTGIPEIPKTAITQDAKPSGKKNYWPLFLVIAALLVATGAYFIFLIKRGKRLLKLLLLILQQGPQQLIIQNFQTGQPDSKTMI